MQHGPELTKQLAQQLHDLFVGRGELVIWSITTNTRDFGKRFVARPFIAPNMVPNIDHGYLIADTLEELREKLPNDLERIGRQIDDDPVIIEVWL